MKKNLTLLLTVLLVTNLFAASEKAKVYNIITPWKYFVGDKAEYKSPSFDDSKWNEVAFPGSVPLNGEQYMWARQIVKVPTEMKGQTIYLNLGHAYASYEIYLNGILVDTFGRLPPKNNVRQHINKVILVPENFTSTGEVSIALRCWTNIDVMNFTEPFGFCNAAYEHKIMSLRNFVASEAYIIIAVICIVLGLYMLSNYIMNPKNRANLDYALSALLISIYFYDMGSNSTVLPSFILQREIARSLLPISMCFLWMFLQRYATGRCTKSTEIASAIISVISIGGHLILLKKFDAADLFFTIMLAPIVFTIVYGITVGIKQIKKHNRNMLLIVIAFFIAAGLAVNDILSQARGVIPFVWLQGYAFFVLNIAVFITVSFYAAKNEKEVDRLAAQTKSQNEKIENVFDKAKILSSNTKEIATSLNTAIRHVSDISETSMGSVYGIEAAIHTHDSSLQQAMDSVDKLVESLYETNQHLEQVAESVENSSAGTTKLLEGFSAVGEGIKGAAVFAEKLDLLTIENVGKIGELIKSMNQVEESSTEILSFVKVLDNFSSRTNLLAMNASIEAAHAGKAGEGFSVVANEVKNLSAQSTAQSRKISESVTNITKTIEDCAKLCKEVQLTLEKMGSEADATAKSVKDAAQEMHHQQEEGRHIAEEARNIAEAATNMKQQAKEQLSYSDAVKKSMADLKDASQSVNGSATTLSQASKDLSDNVSSLREMSSKTEDTAAELSQIMVMEE